jgi:mRNA interferase RelE/StbE
MAYQLEVKRSAVKDMRHLPKDVQQRAIDAINTLAEIPIPMGATKLVGHDTLYRIRLGDWRIVYDVDEEAETITILAVKHRRDVYREF